MENAKPTTAADLSEADKRFTIEFAQQVVQLIESASAPGDVPGTAHPDAALDGVMMALALFIEQSPQGATPQALRKVSEEFGKRIGYHAKLFRSVYERTGFHPIMSMLEGAGSTTTVN